MSRDPHLGPLPGEVYAGQAAPLPPKAAQALTLLERVRADRARDARLAEALLFNEAARVTAVRAATPINPQGELFG